MTDSKQTIVVFGATGQQGGGVVRALQAQGKFRIRVVTRSPDKAADLGADEIVSADLTKPETLSAAFEGAHGAFVVTNFWAGPDVDEVAQGKAAVDAAKAAGVSHFVWSTLPDVESISGGKFDVVHFTEKAKVNRLVSEAGFDSHTFVEAPFYFQNLTGMMGPQPQDDGSKQWTMPMAADAKVIHMGDIAELGQVVAGAFDNPEKVGNGQTLAHVGELASWNDLVETLNEQGHQIRYQSVPGEVYDGFYQGAKELREMMNYFEAHTYMGPDADAKIALAREVSTAEPTSFADWARQNMPAESKQ